MAKKIRRENMPIDNLNHKSKSLLFPSIVIIVIIIVIIAILAVPNNPSNNNPDDNPTEATNKFPVANAGSDQTVNVNEIVYFDGSGSNDPDGVIVSYEWDYGDGNSGVGIAPSHAYSTTGTYTVMLTVTDSDNATDSDTCIVVVITPTNKKPVANAGSNQTVTLGDTVYFTGTGTDTDGAIIKYEWDFDGDGVYDWSSNTTGSTTYIYDTAGTYNAILRVTDNNESKDTDYCIITIENPPGSAIILSHSIYVTGSDRIHVVGEVQNTGYVNLEYVKIVVTYYNSGGTVIGSSYTYIEIDIIVPQQKSPFDSSLPTNGLNGTLDHYELEVRFKETTEVPYRDFEILSHNGYLDSIDAYHVVGEVKNTGSQNADFVKIVVTFYEAGGTVIAVDYTYSDPSDLDIGETGLFDAFTWDTNYLAGTIANYIIQVEAYIF